MGKQRTRRTFMKDCSTSAAALAALSASRAGAGGGRGPRGHALSLRHLRDAVRRVGPAPGALPDLRGRAAVRQPRRPEVDDARGPAGVAQERHQARRRTGLYSINTEPKFGIGQRAFLIRTDEGNVLWDCVGLLDDATIAQVKELGGIAEIAISHPHYYTSMVEWSRAFGGAPIHLHEAERPWVMRPDPCIRFWKGQDAGAARRPEAGQHRRPLRGLPGPALARGRRRHAGR